LNFDTSNRSLSFCLFLKKTSLKLKLMKIPEFISNSILALFFSITEIGCNENKKVPDNASSSASTKNKEAIEDEAWQMEEQYWDYVQKTDTLAYKKLWHDAFMGYPSFGDGVSDKSKIAVWIPELHQDPDLKFSYKLYKKASNAIDDVVIVFYDADEIWTNTENKITRKETFKFTHTWKKYGDKWLILGGMAAKKNQDTLNN